MTHFIDLLKIMRIRKIYLLHGTPQPLDSNITEKRHFDIHMLPGDNKHQPRYRMCMWHHRLPTSSCTIRFMILISWFYCNWKFAINLTWYHVELCHERWNATAINFSSSTRLKVINRAAASSIFRRRCCRSTQWSTNIEIKVSKRLTGEGDSNSFS